MKLYNSQARWGSVPSELVEVILKDLTHLQRWNARNMGPPWASSVRAKCNLQLTISFEARNIKRDLLLVKQQYPKIRPIFKLQQPVDSDECLETLDSINN